MSTKGGDKLYSSEKKNSFEVVRRPCSVEDLTILEISIVNEVFRDSQIILIYLTFSLNTQFRKHYTSIFNSLVMDKCYF